MYLKETSVLLFLSACITFGLVACDSGGSSPPPPEERLAFPDRGNFGPNLLSGEVDMALASETYSMRAEKTGEIDSVRLRIDRVGDMRGSDTWSRSLSSVTGWSTRDLDETGSNEEWTLLGETGEAEIFFSGTDTLRLRIFVGSETEPLRQVRIPWEE
ncbi:hypothetical protein [Salinibacter ruber]|uniref:hypothetical protein n=1 Tax=Salinibacter ruber TaxID=146919 RepID=UPI0021696BBB|nr:hypothetical protein [Salinibacter ruber]MCS4185211.1 hypothetical protein [Salinibacter ruber]